MSREIKFRAFDGYKHEMYITEANNDSLRHFFWALDDHDMLSEPMQYTGLKDKNGVDIYEGDIIVRRWSDGSILQKFEVKWFDDKCGYAINPQLLQSTRHNQQTNMTAHGFEVIGNIYSNPELLENSNA